MINEKYNKTIEELIKYRDERDWKQFHKFKKPCESNLNSLKNV